MAPAVSAGMQHAARIRIAFVLGDSLGVVHIADVRTPPFLPLPSCPPLLPFSRAAVSRCTTPGTTRRAETARPRPRSARGATPQSASSGCSRLGLGFDHFLRTSRRSLQCLCHLLKLGLAIRCCGRFTWFRWVGCCCLMTTTPRRYGNFDIIYIGPAPGSQLYTTPNAPCELLYLATMRTGLTLATRCHDRFALSGAGSADAVSNGRAHPAAVRRPRGQGPPRRPAQPAPRGDVWQP